MPIRWKSTKDSVTFGGLESRIDLIRITNIIVLWANDLPIARGFHSFGASHIAFGATVF